MLISLNSELHKNVALKKNMLQPDRVLLEQLWLLTALHDKWQYLVSIH